MYLPRNFKPRSLRLFSDIPENQADDRRHVRNARANVFRPRRARKRVPQINRERVD